MAKKEKTSKPAKTTKTAKAAKAAEPAVAATVEETLPQPRRSVAFIVSLRKNRGTWRCQTLLTVEPEEVIIWT